jgi:small subunit ribosomal protein S4
VNGRRTDVPSFRVKPGMRVTLDTRSREIARITEALEALERRSLPGWLELEKEAFTGVVKAMPTREDITMPIQEQLIVELYSR